MLEHHKRHKTTSGGLERPSQWVIVSEIWYYPPMKSARRLPFVFAR